MVVKKAPLQELPPRRKPTDKPGETIYYRLPLYQAGYYANLRTGYNQAMRILDRTLHEFNSRIAVLETQITLLTGDENESD